MVAYVITVDFRLRPGAEREFRKLIKANARASVRDEPGCRRFDVLQPAEEPGRILLYEIYDSRAAFDEHVKSPHFARFDSDSRALIASKQVTEYQLVCEGAAGETIRTGTNA